MVFDVRQSTTPCAASVGFLLRHVVAIRQKSKSTAFANNRASQKSSHPMSVHFPLKPAVYSFARKTESYRPPLNIQRSKLRSTFFNSPLPQRSSSIHAPSQLRTSRGATAALRARSFITRAQQTSGMLWHLSNVDKFHFRSVAITRTMVRWRL